MIRNGEDKFDLEIRSLLKDAEVEAPAGVWEAVSSRLGNGTRAAAWKMPFWGWAGMSLAAAALAAGIFLAGTRDSVLPPSSEQPAVALVDTPAEEPATAEEFHDTTNEQTIHIVSTPAKASRMHAMATPAAKEAVMEQVDAGGSEPETVPAATETTVAWNPQETAATAPAPREPEPFAIQKWEDPFAEPEAKKTSRRIHADFTIDGLMSGNNARPGLLAMATSPSISGTNRSTILETSTSAYGIPVSFGVGVRIGLTDRLSVGSGINYSLLSRTFSGIYTPVSGISADADFRHTMHYIGVPVNVYFNVMKTRNLSFHVFGGGTAEYCVNNNYTATTASYEDRFKVAVHGMQFSLATGLGVEFRLSDHLHLFLDPGARYYFNCHQPKSIRTEKPFLINLDAGLRIHL